MKEEVRGVMKETRKGNEARREGTKKRKLTNVKGERRRKEWVRNCSKIKNRVRRRNETEREEKKKQRKGDKK